MMMMMMMRSGDGVAPQGGLYSAAMQRRMDAILDDADRLFSLGWLRRRMWTELAAGVDSVAAGEFCSCGAVVRGSAERRFVWEFLSACQRWLPDVENRIVHAFADVQPLLELKEEREELICEFARMPQSRSWERVVDDDVSWRQFAARLFEGSGGTRQEDVWRFFDLLDHISILTDFLCGRAGEYGVEVDAGVLESLRRKELGGQIAALFEDGVLSAERPNELYFLLLALQARHRLGTRSVPEFVRMVAEAYPRLAADEDSLKHIVFSMNNMNRKNPMHFDLVVRDQASLVEYINKMYARARAAGEQASRLATELYLRLR